MEKDVNPVKGDVYKTDGKVYDFTKMKEQITLKFLQESVGGYIQIVPLGDSGKSMVMNEEGKLMSLPINEKATALFRHHNGGQDYIVGDAIVLETKYIM